MAQNIYDNQEFFEGYAKLNRSVHGLDGAPEWPSIVKMLPPLHGMNVVDLGCGYGWFCEYARDNGAAHVLGLDISVKMLEKAQEMTKDLTHVTYKQKNLEELTIEPESIDLAYSSLTLHYIEDLSKLFHTIYQALRPGGYFVFSAEHPVYTAPKNPGWLVDKEDGQKSWPVNSYQLEGKRVTNWMVDGVIKQHRLLSTYLNLLIEKGFIIKYIEEFGPTKQQILESPWLDEEKERPMIFLTSVEKPNVK